MNETFAAVFALRKHGSMTGQNQNFQSLLTFPTSVWYWVKAQKPHRVNLA